jgi:hypothetical protein
MTGADIHAAAVFFDVAVHVAAVVGSEQHDGVVGQSQAIESLQDPAQALIHAAEHGGHDGVGLLTAWVSLVGEGLSVRFLEVPRSVHAVLPDGGEEGSVAAPLDETNRLIGQAIDDVFAVGAGGDGSGLEAVGRKIAVGAGRAGIGLAVPGDLVSLPFGPVRLGESQVPLAEMPGGIPGVAQGFGEGVFVGIEITETLRRDDRPVGRSRRRITGSLRRKRRLMPGGRGQAEPGRILPGEDAGAGRRTEGVRRVGVGEPHAARGQTVDVGRFVVAAAVNPTVHPAHVVYEEQDDVGAVRGGGDRGRPAQCCQAQYHQDGEPSATTRWQG